MVTTFIMAPGWNRSQGRCDRCGHERTGYLAWTALRDALATFGVTRFALGTPYPNAIHAVTLPFFDACGYDVVGDATLDSCDARCAEDIGERLSDFVDGVPRPGAQAIVLLATDLPSFAALSRP